MASYLDFVRGGWSVVCLFLFRPAKGDVLFEILKASMLVEEVQVVLNFFVVFNWFGPLFVGFNRPLRNTPERSSPMDLFGLVSLPIKFGMSLH